MWFKTFAFAYHLRYFRISSQKFTDHNWISETVYSVVHSYKKKILRVYSFSEQVPTKGNSLETTW